MPAKNRNPHQFAVGDRAIVVASRRDQAWETPDGACRLVETVVDDGTVTQVTAVELRFASALDKNSGSYRFRRKGSEWIENKKDHYRLEPPPTR